MLRQLHLPGFLMPGAWAKHRAVGVIRGALKASLDRRLVQLREGEPAPQNDIAAGLIAQSDPLTGQSLSDSELLDEVATLFLAGHETSASALAWSLYLLATHPDIQDRVLAENPVRWSDQQVQFDHIRKHPC